MLSTLLLLATSVSAASPNATKQFDDAFGPGPFLVVINFRSNTVIAWTSPAKTLKDAVKSEAEAALET